MNPTVRPWLSVALIFLSGIVINELSDKIELSGWIIVVTAAAVLLVMVAVEHRGDVGADSVASRAIAGNLSDSLFIALLAMVIGFIFGAIALLPIFKTSAVQLPQGRVVYNYEIGAVVPIVLLTCIAAVNRRPVLLIAMFGGASVAGMTLAIMTLADELNDASSTYVGWLVLVAIPVVFVYYSQDFWRVLKELFLPRGADVEGANAEQTDGSQSDDVNESNDRPTAGADCEEQADI